MQREVALTVEIEAIFGDKGEGVRGKLMGMGRGMRGEKKGEGKREKEGKGEGEGGKWGKRGR